jgi:hypothetical protein
LDGTPGQAAPVNVMPAWERYRLCAVAQEPAILLELASQIAEPAPVRIEPPEWMKPWSAHVMRHPLRTSVDPSALELACLIHAALRMAEQQNHGEARALLLRVVARRSGEEFAYYVQQAKESLASLPPSEPQVAAFDAKGAMTQTFAIHD